MVSSEILATVSSTTPSATTAAGVTTTESGAPLSGDFVAMLTQLLGGATAGIPASATIAADTSADASRSTTALDTTTSDAASADSALADALSAMLANAPPIVSQAIAQFIAERAPTGSVGEGVQPAANAQSALNVQAATVEAAIIQAGTLQAATTMAATTLAPTIQAATLQPATLQAATLQAATTQVATKVIATQSKAMTGRMLADGATDILRNSQTILQSALTSDPKSNTSDSSAAQSDGGATPDGSNSAGGINAAINVKADQTTPDFQLKERVGTGPWHDELGAKLTWMVERGVQTGSLILSPEHLGPLEVRISVQNDQATVWFGAAHAETRASLEQALPRLRELFAASGLSLADAGVFREPPREAFKNNSGNYFSGNGQAVDGGVAIIGTRNGLLDAYA